MGSASLLPVIAITAANIALPVAGARGQEAKARRLQEANVWHTESCPIIISNMLFFAETHLGIFSDVTSIDQCCEMCRNYENCTAFSLGEANAAAPGLAGRCFLKAIAEGECPLDLGRHQEHVSSGMPFDNGCYATTTTTMWTSTPPVLSSPPADVNWNVLWLILTLLLLLLLCLAIWAFMPGRRRHYKTRGLHFPGEFPMPIATSLVVPPPMQPVAVSVAQQQNTYTEGFVDGMAAAVATGQGPGRKSVAAWRPPPE